MRASQSTPVRATVIFPSKGEDEVSMIVGRVFVWVLRSDLGLPVARCERTQQAKIRGVPPSEGANRGRVFWVSFQTNPRKLHNQKRQTRLFILQLHNLKYDACTRGTLLWVSSIYPSELITKQRNWFKHRSIPRIAHQ